MCIRYLKTCPPFLASPHSRGYVSPREASQRPRLRRARARGAGGGDRVVPERAHLPSSSASLTGGPAKVWWPTVSYYV
jgi:hypothetical protein